METIKSFTDLEQSKKLAEILPIESADFHYVRNTHDFMGNPVDGKWSYPKYGNPDSKFAHYVVQNFSSYEIIPCWSLAALLDVFPNSEQKSVDICNGGWKGEEYVSDWFCSYDDYEKNYFETTNSDNPIDACYEMIIKLHEKNLL